MKRYLMLGLVAMVVLGLQGSLLAQTAAGQASAGAGNTGAASAGAGVQASGTEGAEELVLADFNSGDKPNNLGGDFGSWDKDPNDETQVCQMAFEGEDATGDAAGYSIRMDYDVDSPNPAYNGFWMKLNNLDATAYNTINFYLRGAGDKPFTKRVKIELKDATMKPSPYIVTGITGEWQKFSIPFEKFRRIKSWDGLTEFVVVFDDINSNPKAGTIYIDQVTLSRA